MYEVSVYNESKKLYNPTLRSPNTPFEQPFYQTRDTLTDVDTYSQFLKNAIRRFRSSRTYKNYIQPHGLYSQVVDHHIAIDWFHNMACQN